MEPVATEMGIIIIIIIITVMATLSGRKRRQVHYWLYLQLAFCDIKNDEQVAPCWKTGCETLTGKQLPFCVISVTRGLVIRGREVLVSELAKLRGKDNCGLDECSRVKFKNPVDGGCSYTTASSRLNCTPRRSHVRTVSSGSENCSHSLKLRFQHIR